MQVQKSTVLDSKARKLGPTPWSTALWWGAILLLAGCSPSERDWQQTVKLDTPEGYEHFANANPLSEHKSEALIRRSALIDERDWASARSENSSAAYAGYLVAHPNGIWSALAAQRRDLAGAAESAPNGESEDQTDASEPSSRPQSAMEGSSPPIVQFGAFSSAALAQKEWGRLEHLFPELKPLQHLISESEGAESKLFRLRVELPTREDADLLCSKLTKRKEPCLLVAPSN